jgi:hypothetical protein
VGGRGGFWETDGVVLGTGRVHFAES